MLHESGVSVATALDSVMSELEFQFCHYHLYEPGKCFAFSYLHFPHLQNGVDSYPSHRLCHG